MSEPAFEIPKEVLIANPKLAEDWEQQERDDEVNKAKSSGKTDEEIEQAEIDLLLERGDTFYCPTIFRAIFGKKRAKWHVKPMSASTIVRLCEQYLKIGVNEKDVSTAGIIEAKNLAFEHGRRLAHIVAISVVGATPFIGGIMRRILTGYFYARMTPHDLLQHAIKLNDYKPFVDFLTTIRLTQGQRLTQPVLIVEKSESEDKKG